MKHLLPSEFYWHGATLADILGLLPFDRERLEDIDERSDVIRFCIPFTRTLVLLLPDGRQVTPGMGESEGEITAMFRDYMETNLDDFCQKCRRQFFDKEMYAAIGMAMKYPFALLMVQRAFHLEDMADVNWMPLYDEAVEDLECAFLLSANCFYKQALQVLRSVIELSVAHGYFIFSKDAFEQWRDDPNYRLPYVRGNGGMLHRLHQAQWIDDRIYETGYELYGLLNGCVHATPGRMGSRRGEMDTEKLAQFCAILSRVGRFVIDLTMHFLLGSESLHIASPGPSDSTDDIPF